MKYLIYQLNETPETSQLLFKDSASLEKMNAQVDLNNYHCVYEGIMDATTSLESIFERFNINRPADFTGHSLSVSDVILTYDEHGAQAFFVDSVGFKELASISLDELATHIRLDRPAAREKPPLYTHTMEYAKATGEKDLYRMSRLENIRCRKAIDEAIGDNFDGMHLDTSCVRPLLDEYGIDRMKWVLANTLLIKSYDGRFSRSNKEWGASVGIPVEQDAYGSMRGSAFELESHPAVLDGFISAVHKEINLIQSQEAEKEAKPVPEAKNLTVLVIEPNATPYVKEIAPGLDSLQHEVGGYIEVIYPFDDSVALIFDEEGKMKGKTMNRSLRDENGGISDIVCGTFLITGIRGEDFYSLDDRQIKTYSQKFEHPEMFVFNGRKITVIPMRGDEQNRRPSVRAALNAKLDSTEKQTSEKHREMPGKGRNELS